MNKVPQGKLVGRRVVVTGIAGAGKSTFSRALSDKTGLPVIHLDIHFWKPGWVEPSEVEWSEKQRDLIISDEWILDGNYHATLELRLERADTAVFLDTPWWGCAWRALVRGSASVRLASSCRAAVTSRLCGACAKSGRCPGASGEGTDLNAIENWGLCRGTGIAWRCTFCAPGARSATSSVDEGTALPVTMRKDRGACTSHLVASIIAMTSSRR